MVILTFEYESSANCSRSTCFVGTACYSCGVSLQVDVMAVDDVCNVNGSPLFAQFAFEDGGR